MPDKKVSKSAAARPLSPSRKLESSLSDTGTVNMAEPKHDKAKAALTDKFRQREERWRREQSLHERQGEPGSLAKEEAGSEAGEAAIEEAEELAKESEPTEAVEKDQGGAS